MAYELITGDRRQEWDAIAEKSSEILQSWGWGLVKAPSGWEPLRVTFPGGAASVLKRKLPYVNMSFFYIPRGPVLDLSSGKDVAEFIQAMKELSKRHKAVFLRMDPEVSEDNSAVKGLLGSSGLIPAKKQIQPRSTFILDISRDLESIKASFESKFRYNIHVAEKHGVEIKMENTEDAVEKFHSIYMETASRQTFIIHPLSYYKNILREVIGRGNGAIFMAYKDSAPVAGVIIFNFGKRAWYMYGASSSAARNHMPNNLLHWEVIKWAKARGLKEYDLWGIPSRPDEKHPLWGVYRFKKGFNGELKKFIGAYDLPFNLPLYYLLDRGIYFYRDIIRFIKKGKFSDSLGE